LIYLLPKPQQRTTPLAAPERLFKPEIPLISLGWFGVCVWGFLPCFSRAAGALCPLLRVDGWRDGVGSAASQMGVDRFIGFFLGCFLGLS